MNGAPKNLRIAPAGSTNGAKVDPNDPQIRKLVYNAYREMLSKKHADANVIVDNAPQELVTKDQGVGSRVESMMRQQSELKGGNMNAGGPPPPPPPPPIPGVIPSSRLPSEIPNRPAAMNQPPAALAGAMMKDRKPFTYTPGGLDLSEISNQYQPNHNGDNIDQGPNSADFGVPVQSRSFRVLQNVLDHHDTADAPTAGVPMKVEVPLGAPPTYFNQQNGGHRGSLSHQNGTRGSISNQGGKRGSISQTNEKRGSLSLQSGQKGGLPEKRGSFAQQGAGGPRGSISQTSNDKRGSISQQSGEKRGSFSNASEKQAPISRPNGHRGSVGNITNRENNINKVASQTGGLQIIQHSVGGVSKVILGQNGGSEPTSPDSKELSNIFKNQVRISANTDEARTRGGHFPTKNLNSGQKTGSDDEISNYMRPIVPQAQTSVSQGGLQSQQPIYNQTQYHPQQISEQGQSANQAQSQNQPQYPMSGMHSTQNDNMPKSKEGPTTSRFFRMLQTITDTLPDGAEPQGPIHIPNMRPAQQHSQHQPQPNQYQQQPPQPLYQHQSGVNNAASTEQTVPEPKKYMGSNIPSRSFRMLQAMTGSDDVAGPGQSDL